MPRPPAIRRRRQSPWDKQVLGVAVRRAERGTTITPGAPLKLTEPRVKLMHAIGAGEVKRGLQQYRNDWRWHGLTVTARIEQLIGCGWCEVVDGHPKLTDAGREALPGGA